MKILKICKNIRSACPESEFCLADAELNLPGDVRWGLGGATQKQFATSVRWEMRMYEHILGNLYQCPEHKNSIQAGIHDRRWLVKGWNWRWCWEKLNVILWSFVYSNAISMTFKYGMRYRSLDTLVACCVTVTVTRFVVRSRKREETVFVCHKFYNKGWRLLGRAPANVQTFLIVSNSR